MDGAVLGQPGSALIAEGSDVLVFGDGGAGKTTLTLDLACHLAAGDDWLGVTTTRPQRVLMELEGARPLFRKKVGGKLAAWTGGPLGDRLAVIEAPWAHFTLADEEQTARMATTISEHEIDVLLIGPVTEAGMDTAGTIAEVRAFVGKVGTLRRACGRNLTAILVHHQAKNGAVSGAWEGAVDTLLHVEARGPQRTLLRVQKARWSSTHHGQLMHLAWTPGEGYALEGERDYRSEIVALLRDGKLRTAAEIADSDQGIGANARTVRNCLGANPETFASHNGAEVGRSHLATVFGLVQTPETG